MNELMPLSMLNVEMSKLINVKETVGKTFDINN